MAALLAAHVAALTWQCCVKYSEELCEVVLDGRAADEQAALGDQASHCLGHLWCQACKLLATTDKLIILTILLSCNDGVGPQHTISSMQQFFLLH
jgi:hypothetical protein